MMGLLQAADLAEVTYRKAHHWASRGWVEGVVMPGSGTVCILTGDQVFALCIMTRLVDIGLEPKVAGKIAAKIVESEQNIVNLPGGIRILVEDRCALPKPTSVSETQSQTESPGTAQLPGSSPSNPAGDDQGANTTSVPSSAPV